MKKECKKIPSPKEIVDSYSLRAKKSLGQNFLLDMNITNKIVAAAGNIDGINVIEIGPGPGGLTQVLLETKAAHIYAVEKDDRFIEAFAPILEVYHDKFTLIHEDALKIDITKLCPAPRAIIANLPYNIASPLLISWLQKIKDFESMTLMFQKEVAERIVAKPCSKIYGRISVISQWLCKVEKKFDVPPEAFTPQPKITSSIVHFVPLHRDEDIEFRIMEKITAAAFGQRRKMIRTSLKTLTGDHTEELLKAAGIADTLRAEEISVDKFINLARKYQSMGV